MTSLSQVFTPVITRVTGLISLDDILVIEPDFFTRIDLAEKEATKEVTKADDLEIRARDLLKQASDVKTLGNKKLNAIKKFRQFAGG